MTDKNICAKCGKVIELKDPCYSEELNWFYEYESDPELKRTVFYHEGCSTNA